MIYQTATEKSRSKAMRDRSRVISGVELKKINELLGYVSKAEKQLSVNRIPKDLKKALKDISFLASKTPRKGDSYDNQSKKKLYSNFLDSVQVPMARAPNTGIVIPETRGD
jgi:hypothetical protein